MLGLYIEYVNNLGRAESNTTKPNLGPGFFSRARRHGASHRRDCGWMA